MGAEPLLLQGGSEPYHILGLCASDSLCWIVYKLPLKLPYQNDTLKLQYSIINQKIESMYKSHKWWGWWYSLAWSWNWPLLAAASWTIGRNPFPLKSPAWVLRPGEWDCVQWVQRCRQQQEVNSSSRPRSTTTPTIYVICTLILFLVDNGVL